MPRIPPAARMQPEIPWPVFCATADDWDDATESDCRPLWGGATGLLQVQELDDDDQHVRRKTHKVKRIKERHARVDEAPDADEVERQDAAAFWKLLEIEGFPSAIMRTSTPRTRLVFCHGKRVRVVLTRQDLADPAAAIKVLNLQLHDYFKKLLT